MPGLKNKGGSGYHLWVVMSILRRYSALLLDMNGTFMFGHDRFGSDQDYHATYRALGGRRLGPPAVHGAITSCYETLETIYNDARCFDSFPKVRDQLRTLPETRDLPETELALLEEVVASHELGRVPEEYAETLRNLARTHRLGLVTDIWSRKGPYLEELSRAGVLDLFAVAVFSSDGTSVKPSRKLFDRAVASLCLPRSAVVVVGDSLSRDVEGAKRAGLETVWIDRRGQGSPKAGPCPNFIVRDLRELIGGATFGGNMRERADPYPLPEGLPEPLDDGAARHLSGARLPPVQLPSTASDTVDPSKLPGRTVLYCYPMTGRPDRSLPEGWDLIPGARGCTPQACAFRDRHKELRTLGVRVFGVSTQDTGDQREAVERLHLPFPLLSDAALVFASGLRLPMLEIAGTRLLKRLTLLVQDGLIEHVFYPVFPPDQHAGEVIAWLRTHPGG